MDVVNTAIGACSSWSQAAAGQRPRSTQQSASLCTGNMLPCGRGSSRRASRLGGGPRVTTDARWEQNAAHEPVNTWQFALRSIVNYPKRHRPQLHLVAGTPWLTWARPKPSWCIRACCFVRQRPNLRPCPRWLERFGRRPHPRIVTVLQSRLTLPFPLSSAAVC